MSGQQQAKAWKTMAIRLAKCLDRFVVDCNGVDHRPKEYHGNEMVCPVCAEIRKTQDDFSDLLEKESTQ